MVKIGKFNLLKVHKKTDTGHFLIDKTAEIILLPIEDLNKTLPINSEVKVFVYKNSEGKLIATTINPKIKLNEFAYLQAKEITQYGAFLDWGLSKDILVPFKEQASKMIKNSYYIVHLYLDNKTNRLAASSKINQFLKNNTISVEKGDEVNLLICNKTDLGINVIINNSYKGLLYKNETFQKLEEGDKLKGYIKNIRDDNKIDVSLQKQGFDNIDLNAKKIRSELKNNGGFLNLTDKSEPCEISRQLKMSKKTFKKAVGILYKKKIIRIETKGIFLN